eukprot:6346957-Amphidinium_carterae.1
MLALGSDTVDLTLSETRLLQHLFWAILRCHSGWSLCFAALILAAACPYTSVATEVSVRKLLECCHRLLILAENIRLERRLVEAIC